MVDSRFVREYFHANIPRSHGVALECGQDGDVAWVRITPAANPGRWVVVSSPGNRWFSVGVEGGYSYDYVDEDLDREEVEGALDELLEISAEYISSGGSWSTEGWLKSPVLLVNTSQGVRVLRRDVLVNLRDFLRRWFGNAR
ncbi:MAG: hypothetical protein QM708_07570 [Propioniciclava sp.]|uniref:hypothetical protein n=1 Tax=Propioniciclava sp. TaxID=2038686 RepID=UPI0039E6EB2D